MTIHTIHTLKKVAAQPLIGAFFISGEIMKPLKPPVFSDLKIEALIDTHIDESYRKGFVHGYSAAMEAMLLSDALTHDAFNKVSDFFDKDLMQWRFKRGEYQEAEQPPEYQWRVKQ